VLSTCLTSNWKRNFFIDRGSDGTCLVERDSDWTSHLGMFGKIELGSNFSSSSRTRTCFTCPRWILAVQLLPAAVETTLFIRSSCIGSQEAFPAGTLQLHCWLAQKQNPPIPGEAWDNGNYLSRLSLLAIHNQMGMIHFPYPSNWGVLANAYFQRWIHAEVVSRN